MADDVLEVPKEDISAMLGEGDPAPTPPVEPAPPTEPTPVAPEPSAVMPTPTPTPEPPKSGEEPAPPVPPTPAAPAPPAEPPAPPKTEIELLKEQFAARETALLSQIEEIIKGITAPKPADAPAPGAPPAPEPKPDVIKFIADEKEADEIINSADKLNELLTKVVSHAVEASMVRLPDVARSVSTQQISSTVAVNEFYSANTDLLPYRTFVKHVADEMVSKDPTLTVPKMLEGLAPIVRQRLNLPAPAQTPPAPASPTPAPAAPAGATPAFVPGPGGGGRQPGAKPLAGFEAEVEDMLKDI